MNGNSKPVLVDQNTNLPASTPPTSEGDSKGPRKSNFLYLLGLNTNLPSNSGPRFIWEAVIQSYTNTWGNGDFLTAQRSRKIAPKQRAGWSEKGFTMQLPEGVASQCRMGLPEAGSGGGD